MAFVEGASCNAEFFQSIRAGLDWARLWHLRLVGATLHLRWNMAWLKLMPFPNIAQLILIPRQY